MGAIEALFPTKIYRAELRGAAERRLTGDLERAALAMAADDGAGRAWAEAHGYAGYTSYASLDDLSWRSPEIAALTPHLDRHAAAFGRALDYDLGGRPLALDSIWFNVLAPGGRHGAHIHPNSVISGTFYAAVPEGAGAIRFEDPRLPMMMAAPPRRAKARADNRAFVSLAPKPGTLLLWESFLRHEVVAGAARGPRISVSFNYRWG